MSTLSSDRRMLDDVAEPALGAVLVPGIPVLVLLAGPRPRGRPPGGRTAPRTPPPALRSAPDGTRWPAPGSSGDGRDPIGGRRRLRLREPRLQPVDQLGDLVAEGEAELGLLGVLADLRQELEPLLAEVVLLQPGAPVAGALAGLRRPPLGEQQADLQRTERGALGIVLARAVERRPGLLHLPLDGVGARQVLPEHGAQGGPEVARQALRLLPPLLLESRAPHRLRGAC